MPSGKARFTGGRLGKEKDFPDSVRKELRRFYPNQDAETDEYWGHPADIFVEEIIAEAGFVFGWLDDAEQGSIKEDIKAELQNLHRRSTSLRDDLRRLSPDVDRLLGVGADPLQCAETLSVLIDKIDEVNKQLDSLENKPRPVETDHEAAIELTIRVLRVAKQHGLNIAVTASKVQDGTIKASNAVDLLHTLGKPLNLNYSKFTWRDLIADAREKAPDLKSTDPTII